MLKIILNLLSSFSSLHYSRSFFKNIYLINDYRSLLQVVVIQNFKYDGIINISCI